MLIALEAATVAGLSENPLFTRPFFARYPTGGGFVGSPIDGYDLRKADGTIAVPVDSRMYVGPTYIPSGFGTSRSMQLRGYYLPELAQLPDISNSVGDWLTGNETCPVAGVRTATSGVFEPVKLDGDYAYDVDGCHAFDRVMGATNTSHFMGASEGFYKHYHRIAMTRMAVCKDLELELRPSTPLEEIASYSAEWQECEREAFVYEMFAQHFIQDAWSTGHMWKRWGYTSVAEFPSTVAGEAPPDASGHIEDFPDQYIPMRQLFIALAVATYAGAIHGSKALLAPTIDEALKKRVKDHATYVLDHPLAGLYDDAYDYYIGHSFIPQKLPTNWTFIDDPLCGPVVPLVPWGGEFNVKWSAQGSIYRGAGDEFWAPERESGKIRVKDDDRYSAQRQRLISCSGASMRQVYLAGPRGHGPINPPTLNSAGESVDLNVDPEGPYCWDHWATNESMLAALGPFSVDREWLDDAQIGTSALMGLGNAAAQERNSTLLAPLDFVSRDKLRLLVAERSLVESHELALRFAANAAVDPNGTDSAKLQGADGEPMTFLGVLPSAPPSVFLDEPSEPASNATASGIFWHSHLEETCKQSSALPVLRDQCVASAARGGDPGACTACFALAGNFIPECDHETFGDRFIASRCRSIGIVAQDIPSEWSSLGARYNSSQRWCKSSTEVAQEYCTGVNQTTFGVSTASYDLRNWTIESVVSQSRERPSMCEATRQVGDWRERVSLRHDEGDTDYGVSPILTTFVQDLARDEIVVGGACVVVGSSSRDDTLPTRLSRWNDTSRGEQAFGDFPWNTAKAAPCGTTVQTVVWNRSCADVAILVTNAGIERSGSDASVTLTEPGASFLPINLVQEGEDRCAVRYAPKYSASCPNGMQCGATGYCTGRATGDSFRGKFFDRLGL